MNATVAHRRASLPMYDFVEIRRDHDRLWDAVRTRLASAGCTNLPEVLEHEPELPQAWLDPGLLLSQTCGYPLVTTLAGRVRLLATPCYAAGGCDGPRYRSWLAARHADGAADLADFHGRTVVINSTDSLSGCKVLEMLVGGELNAFFGAVKMSGGHANSLNMVREGAADLAAIDCVTWALLDRHRPIALEGLAIVGEGPSLPALPCITSPATTDEEVGALFGALQAAAREDARGAAERLLVEDFAVVPLEDYRAILVRLDR